jgi:hypothetical protein
VAFTARDLRFLLLALQFLATLTTYSLWPEFDASHSDDGRHRWIDRICRVERENNGSRRFHLPIGGYDKCTRVIGRIEAKGPERGARLAIWLKLDIEGNSRSTWVDHFGDLDLHELHRTQIAARKLQMPLEA